MSVADCKKASRVSQSVRPAQRVQSGSLLRSRSDCVSELRGTTRKRIATEDRLVPLRKATDDDSQAYQMGRLEDKLSRLHRGHVSGSSPSSSMFVDHHYSHHHHSHLQREHPPNSVKSVDSSDLSASSLTRYAKTRARYTEGGRRILMLESDEASADISNVESSPLPGSILPSPPFETRVPRTPSEGDDYVEEDHLDGSESDDSRMIRMKSTILLPSTRHHLGNNPFSTHLKSALLATPSGRAPSSPPLRSINDDAKPPLICGMIAPGRKSCSMSTSVVAKVSHSSRIASVRERRRNFAVPKPITHSLSQDQMIGGMIGDKIHDQTQPCSSQRRGLLSFRDRGGSASTQCRNSKSMRKLCNRPLRAGPLMRPSNSVLSGPSTIKEGSIEDSSVMLSLEPSKMLSDKENDHVDDEVDNDDDCYSVVANVTRGRRRRTTMNGASGLNGRRSRLAMKSLSLPASSAALMKTKRRDSIKSRRRIISEEKVLDAPDLSGEDHSNPLDWSNGNELAIGLKSAVYLWNGDTGATELMFDSRIRIHNGSMPLSSMIRRVCSVRWTHTGTHLAVGSRGGLVSIWDSEKRCCLRRLRTHFSGEDMLGPLEDHSHNNNNNINQIAGDDESRKKPGSDVGCLCWTGHLYASGGTDAMVCVHDVRLKDSLIRRIQAHSDTINALEWNHPTQATLLASASQDKSVLIWDLRKIQDRRKNDGPISSVPLHRIESPRLKESKFRITDSNGPIRAIAWNPRRKDTLAIGGGIGDGGLRVYRLAGRVHRTAEAHCRSDEVCSVKWDRGGRELVTTHGGGIKLPSLRLWTLEPSAVSMRSLRRVVSAEGHSGRALHSSLSPDGCTLCTGAADETLRFWKVFDPPTPKSKVSSRRMRAGSDRSPCLVSHTTAQSRHSSQQSTAVERTSLGLALKIR